MKQYDFIVHTVQEAGAKLMEIRSQGFDVSVKGNDPKNIVTSADTKLHSLIVQKIQEVFPGDAIYSEEGETTDVYQEERLWIVDPIDGSSNFSRNIPHFAIVLGLLENDIPVAGAIYNPVTAELFSFEKGRGAFLNGAQIHTSQVNALIDAYIFLHAGRKSEMQEWGGTAYGALLKNVCKTGNFSAISLDICFVAAGRIEAAVYGTITHTLDIMPALGLLREANGVHSTDTGEAITPKTSAKKVFAANSTGLLNELRTLI